MDQLAAGKWSLLSRSTGYMSVCGSAVVREKKTTAAVTEMSDEAQRATMVIQTPMV